jgi:hypothetical protein
MEATKYREAFEKGYAIVETIRRHSPDGYLSLEVSTDCTVLVCYSPPEDQKDAAVRFGLAEFGKLTKDENGNLRGVKGDVTLDLLSVLKCEIVGYKTEKRPKVVETGDFIETQTPIYRCLSPIVKEVVELANSN